MCPLPGGRQTISWSWAGASFLASHDAFWSTSELHIIFTLIANVDTTEGTVYCRKLCNSQQINLMRWWTTMCCQSSFKALWHWLFTFLELYWRNGIPFFRKTFPCLVLWWWWLSAVRHVGPESPFVSNGVEDSGDSEGHSMINIIFTLIKPFTNPALRIKVIDQYNCIDLHWGPGVSQLNSYFQLWRLCCG